MTPATPSASGTASATEFSSFAGSEWCSEGTGMLSEDACVALPEGTVGKNVPLLIYLHGIIPPKAPQPQKSKVLGIVAAAAKKHGFVALLPRGVRGIGPKAFVDWYAWPTSGGAYKKYATQMVANWLALRANLEKRLDHRFSRVWLAGSSNGAYFLSILAVRGDISVDAFAALSGGARVGTARQDAVKVPFLVAYGSFDATNGDGKGLAAYLRGAGWPVIEREHRFDHGAKAEYLDDMAEAFDRGGEVEFMP